MKKIEDMELFAKEYHVPIARRQTIEYIVSLIKENNYSSFLELGTAIAYSSITLAKNFLNLKITSVEYDLEMVEIAQRNIHDFDVKNRINLIIDDASLYQCDQNYDVIFIDACKKKNWFFLEKYSPNLNKGGTIIVDNMKLDDLWWNAKKEKKQQYDKINEEFKNKVFNSNKYDAILYENIGDGILVIKIKESN